jgi:hypothetical protein
MTIFPCLKQAIDYLKYNTCSFQYLDHPTHLERPLHLGENVPISNFRRYPPSKQPSTQNKRLASTLVHYKPIDNSAVHHPVDVALANELPALLRSAGPQHKGDSTTKQRHHDISSSSAERAQCSPTTFQESKPTVYVEFLMGTGWGKIVVG